MTSKPITGANMKPENGIYRGPDVIATRCFIQVATITNRHGQEQVWTVKQTMPVLVLEECGRKFVIGLN